MPRMFCFVALGELQKERPAYRPDATGGKTADGSGAVKSWWGEVIRRTALGAGADARRLDEGLDVAVDELLHVFSSKEGYKFVDGALQTLSTLHDLGVKTGLVSNCDSGILRALEDLGATSFLEPTVISEFEGFGKPDERMWQVACQWAGLPLEQAVHVGDEFDADVLGASRAGVRPIWFRPTGETDRHVNDADRVAPEGVEVVENLIDVVEVVKRWNSDGNHA